MNNWRLLLFAVVAVFLPVGSITERNLFDGREQCCDHRPDIQETRLHGTYRKSDLEDRRLSTRLLADRFDVRDSRRYETRFGNPLTPWENISVERRFAEPERSVRNQERHQRNLPESRLFQIASSRRDLTRNDRVSLDSTRRNTLEDTRSERRTRDVDLNRNSRTENERRISVRTERNEVKQDAIRPTEEKIRHEIRHKNERVVLRLRENMRDSRYSRISEERRELRRMTSNPEIRQGNQLSDSRESVEKRDIRNLERVAQDALERKQVNRVMQFGRLNQQRSDNRQSRDREFSVLRESRTREEQRRLTRDPLESGALRMREIRSLERLERVWDSRDIRSEARSNDKLERTSERSRISEDRIARLRESRFRVEPQRTVSLSRVENARLEAQQRSNVRKDERFEVRNRNIENRAVSRNSVRYQRFEVADRAERNHESERRTTNARSETKRIDSLISNQRRETRQITRDDSTRAAQIVRARINVQSERTRDDVRQIAREMRERNDIRNFRNSEMARDRRGDSRTEFRLNRERSSLERSGNLEARNTLYLARNVRDKDREITRDRRSIDDRSDSRREFRLTRERISLERTRNLDTRNTISSVRNVRDNGREIARDRRSVEDRSDSRKEFRLIRERSSLERSRNLDARNTLSSVQNVRDNEREVARDRRSVEDRSDSRREFRLIRETSSLERSRNLDTRNAISSARNVRDNDRVVTKERKSVDRIDSRRVTLDRSRSLEARNERETINRAVRNELQTQREQNERSMTIRSQIDRLAMERNDRTTESRNRIQTDLFRVRENIINEKTEKQESANWQYMFYTLQGAYLCGLLVQILAENSTKSKTKNLSWWLPASNNLIQVD